MVEGVTKFRHPRAGGDPALLSTGFPPLRERQNLINLRLLGYSTKNIMKTLLPILMLLMFCIRPAIAEEVPIKASETEWLSQSAYDAAFKQASDNRFLPYKVLGKIDTNGVISYKGYFVPFPPDLNQYYAYIGMNNQWYEARKTFFANAGFKEIWHQSFLDSIHEEVHQAVWLKLIQAPDVGQGAAPKGKKTEDISQKKHQM
jgi:hypothetical protein